MLTPEQLRTYIEQGLECIELRVAGDGHHFEALIVSAAFQGKSRVQRHQIVYKALAVPLKTIADNAGVVMGITVHTSASTQSVPRASACAGSLVASGPK